MFCTNCGKKLAEGSNFCPGCGQKVVKAGDAAAEGQQNVRQEEQARETPKTAAPNEPQPKAASESALGIVALCCAAMFILGIWLSVSIKPGRSFLATIPGALIFGIIVLNKDGEHKAALAVCAVGGLIAGGIIRAAL